VDAVFRVLRGPGRLLQDLLNGSWLGHSLHALVVDVVIGGATIVLFFDILATWFAVEGLATASTWGLGLVWLAGLASVASGLTDFKDTPPNNGERDVAMLHGLINTLAFALIGISFFQRLGGSHDIGFWLLLVGYLLLSVGSYIGGHLVFKYGYMVNYNAFSKGRRAKDFTAVAPVADVPDDRPFKVMFGTTAVMLVRRGEVVHALKDSCSHAGGPLSEGELRGDTITCPWHGSVFRITDGAVVHGPAGTRQVSYAARISGDQVELQGPRG
jgi:nitrite reductase/ring-hydroxylating ferredoxin subunit/uncharacterized membrane protein